MTQSTPPANRHRFPEVSRTNCPRTHLCSRKIEYPNRFLHLSVDRNISHMGTYICECGFVRVYTNIYVNHNSLCVYMHLHTWDTSFPVLVSWPYYSTYAFLCVRVRVCAHLSPLSPMNRAGSGHFQIVQVWTLVPAILTVLVVWWVKMSLDRDSIQWFDGQNHFQQ